jgi:hypothetical protein
MAVQLAQLAHSWRDTVPGTRQVRPDIYMGDSTVVEEQLTP